jgi:hypothetical protein
MSARTIFWTAATVKKRRLEGDRVIFYARRYLARVLVAMALGLPLLIVATYQLAPGRGGRGSDDVVRIAVAASDAADVGIGTSRSRMVAILDEDRQAGVDDPIALVQPAQIRPVVWYRVAATQYGISPHLLEALHQVESSAATDGCWPNEEGSSTIGPFQFKRATFETYGLDGNRDGVVDICGFADSHVSAANYLHALGATDDVESQATWQALDRYGTDADRVVSLARYYRLRDDTLTAVAR